MKINEQAQKAKEFAEFWKDKGYEKGQSQSFWLQLLTQVYGVEKPTEFIEFEDQVHIDKNTGFIDGYIPIILCFVNSVISLMISLNFKDIKLNENENLENKFNFKEFKCQLLTILKSKRSKSIFLYAFFFMGIFDGARAEIR